MITVCSLSFGHRARQLRLSNFDSVATSSPISLDFYLDLRHGYPGANHPRRIIIQPTIDDDIILYRRAIRGFIELPSSRATKRVTYTPPPDRGEKYAHSPRSPQIYRHDSGMRRCAMQGGGGLYLLAQKIIFASQELGAPYIHKY